ncbi:MAG: Ig-like domain-containing protein [Lachnospiraceae bacterium]|nr:Ig-like domain-containing protein [Lachnospiraceae bacterium]
MKNENTVQVDAEITGGTANVSEITTDTIEKVVNNTDKESKVDTITIDLSGAKQEVTGVKLSKTTVETLAKATAEEGNGIATATIELSKATVVLDNKTLETLVEQAKGAQIELVVADTQQQKLNTAQQATLNEYQVATTFEAYFTSDGERIHDFNGGKAVVSIKFTPEARKDSSYYHLVYVADDGKLTRYKTKYQSGKLMFTTTHFSDYAVIYDTSEKNETDVADGDDGTDTNVTIDTSYRKLRLRATKSAGTTNVLKWNKVADADGYVIYGNLCNTRGKTYKLVKQVTIKDNATTSWIDTKLASGTYYKYCIKAYKLVDGKKAWIAKSKVVHSTTTGGKYGNAASVKVNKTAVSLAVGKTFTMKAEQIVKDLPIKKHAAIKYESSNSRVASVTSKGVIKAKKKGSCYIYVYAQNGMYKRVKVTVK